MNLTLSQRLQTRFFKGNLSLRVSKCIYDTKVSLPDRQSGIHTGFLLQHRFESSMLLQKLHIERRLSMYMLNTRFHFRGKFSESLISCESLKM